ncbi:MAG: TldD/PmbA family protein [candidate division WOR-3 bacterium]
MTWKPFLEGILTGLGVSYADIRIEESDGTRIFYRGKELEEIGSNFERGGCLRVFHQGNWGVATFNNIGENLRQLAIELAREVEKLPRREGGLSLLSAFNDIVRIPESADPRRVSLAEKKGLIHNYNEILLKAKGVITTVAVYQDSHRVTYFYSTEGRYIEEERVYTGFSCRAIARDGANIQDYGESFGKSLGFDSLKNHEAMVERVAKIAVDLLKAEPVRAGRYKVVIDPLLSGIFAHEAFGHLSEADHIAENERLREMMRIGARFGIDELTIVDDATLPNERGSFRYDDEGAPGRRTELIKQGVLAGHLHNRQTSARMGEPNFGNGRAVSYRFAPIVRMSNTFIEPRDKNLQEMLDDIAEGLYVVGSRGGMTELEAFTFSSQYAFKIEKGRLTNMVRDVTLSGNVFETLKNIEAIGNDLIIYGGIGGCGKGGQAPLPVGTGGPHLMIKDVIIGGR